jgi:hypothetical protein
MTATLPRNRLPGRHTHSRQHLFDSAPNARFRSTNPENASPPDDDVTRWVAAQDLLDPGRDRGLLRHPDRSSYRAATSGSDTDLGGPCGSQDAFEAAQTEVVSVGEPSSSRSRTVGVDDGTALRFAESVGEAPCVPGSWAAPRPWVHGSRRETKIQVRGLCGVRVSDKHLHKRVPSCRGSLALKMASELRVWWLSDRCCQSRVSRAGRGDLSVRPGNGLSGRAGAGFGLVRNQTVRLV